MKIIKSITVWIFFLSLLLGSCSNRQSNTSTPEDREQLFEYIIEKTKTREAFSPIKNKIMAFDPLEEMMAYREEMIKADTDEDLFNVLMKISNARRDRHLSVSTIDGGLLIDDSTDLAAPVIFRVDYTGENDYFLFVGDYAKNISDYTGEYIPAIGDKLIGVNGKSFPAFFDEIRPYTRYSTIKGLWKSVAEEMTLKNHQHPLSMDNDEIVLELEKSGGETYTVTLPYLDPESIDWLDTYKSHGENRYSGFERLLDRETFDIYISPENKNVLLIDWYGFRENLVEDMNFLMDYAAENNMLDYDIIWDGTRSRGGSLGAYAVQRLFPKEFKTTFGNVKISDVIPIFIERREKAYEQRRDVLDGGVTELLDDGTWLIEWLRTDVTEAIERGDDYSNNVPFKLAHLPKDSDGIIYPAEKHFTGNAVCLFGPHGGSHLDQFASIVIDNKLAYTVGMSTGGYSNTWEWDEDLVFPISGKPVVNFMWDIGHTIRPNGEVLEGNPAQVDKYIPQGRDNYLNYYDLLLDEALSYLNR
ncbi:MAG: hypothetical protein V2I34_00310 [Bacteroidales bacterium]|jgi:hypothetical protein|nr:hypothetical protein [Bacteroidales bacterium]